MKQPKKPNRRQKILISSPPRNLNFKSWLVVSEDDEKLVIISRSGRQQRNIYKAV